MIGALMWAAMGCEDENSPIGSVIANGEVAITVDTFYYNLNAKAIEINSFDSKTGNLMLGSIQTRDYGALDCSFVTRLMCAPYLDVPDSLLSPDRVDSCKFVMGAVRNDIVGDSLAPQQLAIYKLTKQLPSDINNLFNPEGYYNPADPLAKKSYTVSSIAMSDSAFYKNEYVSITVDLPKSFGQEVFQKYIDSPEIFAWPQIMAEKYLPGFYVKPSFGKGCVANIQTAYLAVFYHSLKEVNVIEDNDTTTQVIHVNNVTFPFTISPEVLSSNRITYAPSKQVIERNISDEEGVVITTPGGYIASFEFPAQSLIDRYHEKNSHLSTVNDLILYIPAEVYDSDSGVGIAQNLLMVKSSEYENFFNENKTPDNKTSFTGVYDPVKKRYYFTTMREYFLDLLNKETLTPEDLEFTLVPVEITTEIETSSYYGTSSTYVTKCKPYIAKPTMTLLHTEDAMATFSFSTQVIE